MLEKKAGDIQNMRGTRPTIVGGRLHGKPKMKGGQALSAKTSLWLTVNKTMGTLVLQTHGNEFNQ